MKGGFNQVRNAYLNRLTTVKPGHVIDALKEDIKRTETESKIVKNQMADAVDHIIKTKASKNDYHESISKARNDWKELYRDLATFEMNFAVKNKR